ncbi:MAG: ACP S-malonyltransferase [Gammaproteobacteria bacterium]|nr:ACP S-malonyltransferase [Gammaproteobacteria bacterium]
MQIESAKKIAIVFPGQGSQKIGMLAEFAEKHTTVKTTFDEASTVLGYDLWDLVQNDPNNKLNQTEYTQVAMLAADIAAWRVWCEQNQQIPSYLAGHSLGEYAALVAAESLDFKDAITLVSNRGRLMQAAVPDGIGGMAAIIGLDNKKISQLCDAARENEALSPANFNSIGQTVIAGNLTAIKRAVVLSKEYGAKLAKVLPMSVPSHCELLKDAALEFAKILQKTEIKIPSMPVIHNHDLKIHTDPNDIRNALVKQLYNPVRWVETIEFFVKEGISEIVEMGPGTVLTGLNKRITKLVPTVNFVD